MRTALFGLEPVERDGATVLTPHAGELARLLDTRLGLGRRAPARGRRARCAERFGAVVLLKGADTIVRAPDGRTRRLRHGAASLATAGTGDVLTGIARRVPREGARRRPRRRPPPPSAHGLAARRACRIRRASSPRDVVDALPSVLLARRDAPLARHDRPRRDPAQRRAAAPAARARRSSGRSSRPTATGTAPSTSAGPRSTAARRRSASRRWPRRSRSARRSPSRILVLGPTAGRGRRGCAREASLELTAPTSDVPEGVPVHLKLDTGHGPLGARRAPAPGPVRRRSDDALRHRRLRPAFAREQLERFLRGDRAVRRACMRHVANSAAALRAARARLDAARCGIALYGIDPVRRRPRPVRRLAPGAPLGVRARAGRSGSRPGESTGYGRRFVATEETWIGIVPVGYADGFRRDLTGTEVSSPAMRRRGRRNRLDGRLRRRASPATGRTRRRR